MRQFLVKYLFREEFVLKIEKKLYKLKKKGSLAHSKRYVYTKPEPTSRTERRKAR
jgi:hypothetical protein